MSASNTASSTRRRLSLLAGSSLFAAVVMAGAGGLALAPSAAMAANECAPVSPTLALPGDNGATADTYLCAASYPSISYTTNGALTLQLQNNVTATTGGLTVVGSNADAVTISRIADSPANSGDPSLTNTAGVALQITRATAGGNISVNLSDPSTDTADTPLSILGTTAAVRLSNMGTNTTVFTTTNGTITASGGPAIEMSTAGTGALTLTNGSATTGTTAGAWLRNTGIAAGNITVTNNGAMAATAGVGLDLATGGTGNFTITNGSSTTTAPLATLTGTTAAITVAGGTNATLTNNLRGRLTGRVSFTNAGTTNIGNNGEWFFSGTSFLGDGTSALGNGTLGRIGTNDGGAATTLDFGLGTNSFNSTGQLAVGIGAQAASTLFITGLATWNNAGPVFFGFDTADASSDGVANDRIVAAGTVFTGAHIEPDPFAGILLSLSSLTMDVDFSANQTSCAATVSADCFDLRGSSTAGTTQVIVNVAGYGPAQRVVLIDVAGAGTSAASHFTLNSASANYHAVGATGVVESGLFLYELQYDATAKQHALVAVALSGKSLEVARIGRAASEPWRTATGLWHGRQADLRNTLEGRASGTAPAVWLRLGGNFINEIRYDDVQVGGLGQVEYNTGYDQRTTALVGGIDLVRASGDGGALVVGLTAGSLRSDVEYDAATSELELEGYSFGAYASFVAGPLFVDGIVNLTNLDLTHTDLGQAFEGSANSIGYQAEGGYRLFQVGDGAAWIEPLAAVSYVRTQVDDLQVATVGATFDDATSLRGAVGARFAGDMVMEALTAQFSFTARLWKEFETGNTATLSAALGDTLVTDEGPDVLGDLGVAMGLFTLGNRLSAQLTYGVSFNEGYRSTDAGFSVRLQW